MTWTRGRLLGVVSAVVAVLLLVVGVVTYVLSSRAMADVRVTPASLQCITPSAQEWKGVPWVIDTTLVPEKDASATGASADPGEPREPGFWVTVRERRMRCVLVVNVTNEGSSPVKVRDLVFGGWADEPSTREDWVAYDDSTGSRPRSVGEDRQDAAYGVDETLHEGEFARVEMAFERRPGVCRSGGDFLSLQRPRVEVTTWGWRSSLDSDLTVATWFSPSLLC